MANQRLVDLLGQYTGEPDSLNAFVAAAEQELGPDWTQTIYADMANISDDIKERLDHAFNYYAATTAWNELQSYLMQQTPLDYQETLERVPVLEHWLSFFGAAGEEAITQLKEKLRLQGEAAHQSTEPLDNPFAQPIVSEMPENGGIQVTQEQIDAVFSQDEPFLENDANSSTAQSVMPMEQSQANVAPDDEIYTDMPVLPDNPLMSDEMPDGNAQFISNPDTVQETEPSSEAPVTEEMPIQRTDVFDPIAAAQPTQDGTPLQAESESSWRVHRMYRQIDFISNVQAWISFLCLELGYTDFYTYRHYGFLVDVLDKTIAELKDMLAQPDLYEVMNTIRSGGVKFLQDKLIAYEQQAQEGHEMLSDYEPLMPLSVDDLKNKLGAMDLSGEKEYLGPAPDGFEMIDDPYESMNDDDLKKEYEKIEAQGNLDTSDTNQSAQNVTQGNMPQEKQPAPIKNTSQTTQNGVQRKMSFTFGAKPAQQPTQTNGDAS